MTDPNRVSLTLSGQLADALIENAILRSANARAPLQVFRLENMFLKCELRKAAKEQIDLQRQILEIQKAVGLAGEAMSKDRHHWRELILKSGPNTEAREALISKMAERLDTLEGFLEFVLYTNKKIRKITSQDKPKKR